MKCDACGAPVENGKCSYCGKDFSQPIQSAQPVRRTQPTQPPVLKNTALTQKQQKGVYVDQTKAKKKKKRKSIIIVVAVIILIGIAVNSVDKTADTTLSDGIIVSWLEETMNEPKENDVIKALKSVDTINECQAVTEDNDPNNGLLEEDGYISAVFFSCSDIDTSAIEGVDLVDKGTDMGGCIEIYRNEDDAINRMNRLRNMSSLAGGSERIRTVIIRTSSKLSKEQQIELTNKIIKQLENIYK